MTTPSSGRPGAGPRRSRAARLRAECARAETIGDWLGHIRDEWDVKQLACADALAKINPRHGSKASVSYISDVETGEVRPTAEWLNDYLKIWGHLPTPGSRRPGGLEPREMHYAFTLLAITTREIDDAA